MFLRASSATALVELQVRVAVGDHREHRARLEVEVGAVAELRVALLRRRAERALHPHRGPVAGQVGADEQRRGRPARDRDDLVRALATRRRSTARSPGSRRRGCRPPTSSPRLRLVHRPPRPHRHQRREHERHRQQVRAREHGRAEREPADAEHPRLPEPRGDREQRERPRQPERAERLGQLLARGEDQRRVEADERRRGHPRPRPASSAAIVNAASAVPSETIACSQ